MIFLSETKEFECQIRIFKFGAEGAKIIDPDGFLEVRKSASFFASGGAFYFFKLSYLISGVRGGSPDRFLLFILSIWASSMPGV